MPATPQVFGCWGLGSGRYGLSMPDALIHHEAREVHEGSDLCFSLVSLVRDLPVLVVNASPSPEPEAAKFFKRRSEIRYCDGRNEDFAKRFSRAGLWSIPPLANRGRRRVCRESRIGSDLPGRPSCYTDMEGKHC